MCVYARKAHDSIDGEIVNLDFIQKGVQPTNFKAQNNCGTFRALCDTEEDLPMLGQNYNSW